MTQSNFIEEYMALSRITKREAHYCVTKFIECLEACLLAGENVQFPGFGEFKVNTRKEKKVIHPATHKATLIPERKVVFLKQSDQFINKLNNKGSD